LGCLIEALRKNTEMICLVPEDGRLALSSSLFGLRWKNSLFYQLEKENISKALQSSKVPVYTKSILKHVIEGLGEWGDTFHSLTRVRKKIEILDDNPFDRELSRWVRGLPQRAITKGCF